MEELREELRKLEQGGSSRESINASLRTQIEQLQGRIEREGAEYQRVLGEFGVRNEQLLKEKQVMAGQV